MRDLPENSTKQTLFGPGCDVAAGKFLPDIDPKEAATVSQPCENEFRKNIITCKDPEIQLFIDEVNGLDFNLLLSTSLSLLPLYIPILDYSACGGQPINNDAEYVGITLRDFIKSGFRMYAGTLQEQDNIRYRTSILTKSLKNKKVILFLAGEDTLIEAVWNKREKSKLFENIKQAGFYAVTGFNFSVFGGECSFAQILNLKRSLFSSYLLETNQIPVIPHIYAIDKFQIERWVKWLEKNPAITHFTINCQVQKSEANVKTIVQIVSALLTKFPHLHVILQGYQSDKLQYLQDFGLRIHVADKVPVKCASSRAKLEVNVVGKNLLRKKTAASKDRLALLSENIAARTKLISDLIYRPV